MSGEDVVAEQPGVLETPTEDGGPAAADVQRPRARARAPAELARAPEPVARQLAEVRAEEAADVAEQHERGQARLQELRARQAMIQEQIAQLERQNGSAKAAAKKQKSLRPDSRSVEARPGSVPPPPRKEGARWRGHDNVPATVDVFDPAANPGFVKPGPAGIGGSPYLDLVTLATSYADAAGAVKVAEARLMQAEQNGSAVEQRVEAANVETARRKAALLRAIAEVSLEGAKANLDRARALIESGMGSNAEFAEAEAKVRILALIRDSDSAGAPAAGTPAAK